jgi:predicted secreted protein
MLSFLRCSLVCLLLLPVALVYATEDIPLFNQVHIDAQVERDVENDQLEVFMLVEAQGNQPDELAARINETMQWALAQGKGKSGIDISTRSYQTYPLYRDKTIVGWRASQELQLKSVKISELTELVGKLQEKLQVRHMSFSPTRETRVKVENDLISEAMTAFRQRAEIIKGHMDNKNYRIVNIHVNTGQSGPIMYREAMMSTRAVMEDAVAPAVEAGTSKVVVTVSGSVQFF